jgi:WhiB family transcriptional regulator, redox-sensing transcriptional regulator
MSETAVEPDSFARMFQHDPWVKRAPCHGLTALFFSDSAADQRQAKAVCATCPVIAECRTAVDNEPVRSGGVWAGTSQRERRSARHDSIQSGEIPARSTHARSPINHGTNSGYQTHMRYGVPMCGPCRMAHAAANAHYKALRLASRGDVAA